MAVIAKKSLGQNFLINEGIVEKIIKAGEISKDDVVVEVGPGTGNLTKKLAVTAGKLIAVEKDHRLIENLKINFPASEIVEADILEINPAELDIREGEYKIIGNIPYYITSHFIRNVFEKWPQPSLIILTVQKEVAQRIMAKPPDMNLLALSVQFYADVEKVADVSRGSFRPTPNIDSAVIKIKPKKRKESPIKTLDLFKVMKAGFSEKRKQLAGTLSRKFSMNKEISLEILKQAGLKETIRPENLTLDDWIRLTTLLTNAGTDLK